MAPFSDPFQREIPVSTMRSIMAGCLAGVGFVFLFLATVAFTSTVAHAAVQPPQQGCACEGNTCEYDVNNGNCRQRTPDGSASTCPDAQDCHNCQCKDTQKPMDCACQAM